MSFSAHTGSFHLSFDQYQYILIKSNQDASLANRCDKRDTQLTLEGTSIAPSQGFQTFQRVITASPTLPSNNRAYFLPIA